MSRRQILLDTCSYLRLAKSISPLLGVPFGKDKNTLYLHKEIQHELNRSPRLQNKFNWIEEDEHVLERKKIISIKKKEADSIDLTYDYIWHYQKDNKYGLSREDIYCIATALVLGINLVSDDINLSLTAKFFEVSIMNTLELLKIMEDDHFIEHSMVESIVSFLKYNNDFPVYFENQYLALFGKSAPK